jgi:hypothetical protein
VTKRPSNARPQAVAGIRFSSPKSGVPEPQPFVTGTLSYGIDTIQATNEDWFATGISQDRSAQHRKIASGRWPT